MAGLFGSCWAGLWRGSNKGMIGGTRVPVPSSASTTEVSASSCSHSFFPPILHIIYAAMYGDLGVKLVRFCTEALHVSFLQFQTCIS